MNTAILITCYNRKEVTLNTLKTLSIAINNIPSIKFDIYLVDDGSPDGTGEAVENVFPYINVIKGDGTLFWGGGTNLAWYTAVQNKDYDYYLWCNDDSLLYEDALETMFRTLNNRDNVIVCGAFQSAVNNAPTYGGRQSETLIPLSPNGTNELSFTYLNGNLVLIPRKVFKANGYISKIFRQAMGDRDYGLRAVGNKIEMFLSDKYVGTCERHDNLIHPWANPKKKLLQRLKILYSPLGMNPYVRACYHYRHSSVNKAICAFIGLNFQAIFPFLFRKN